MSGYFAKLKQLILSMLVHTRMEYKLLLIKRVVPLAGLVLILIAIMACTTPSNGASKAPVNEPPQGTPTIQSLITSTPTPVDGGSSSSVEFSEPSEIMDANGVNLVANGLGQESINPFREESFESNTEMEEQVMEVSEVSMKASNGMTDMSYFADQATSFEGKVLDKIDAAKFFSEAKEVTVINVGKDYFDVQMVDGEKIRVLSPVKPKYHRRYINEYGLSDIEIKNGFEVGYKGMLKSSQVPKANMGVGTRLVDVTPMASDGILVEEVSPLFTLYTPAVVGPNDYLIHEEIDYDPKAETSSSKSKRWFEIFRSLTKGKIWTIFEQSNRYFTNVDKREWDRMTPGRIFDMMQKFEYLIQIPDRILSIRNPKYISTEEKFKNRYVLHDYSVKDISIRLLVPTYFEMKEAITLKKVGKSDDEVSYKYINTVLKDEEMGDGEKFTWNNPIKIVLVINGREITIYMPTQAVIEVNGKLYKLPPNLIH